MFSIKGTGRATGSRMILSRDMDHKYGSPSRPLASKVGIISRHYIDEDEDQVSLGLRAAKGALREAGIGIEDIDLLISACAVPYQPIPSLSTLFARDLGASDGSLAAIDVNTTCLSFISAFQVATAFIAAGSYQRILIISSEVASRGLPWEHDPETACLFADGAAACILEPGQSEILASRFATYPTGWSACQLASGGTRHRLTEDDELFRRGALFSMNGPALFKLTAAHFPQFFQSLADEACIHPKDLDLVIPHQASPHALKLMTRKLHLPVDRVVDIIDVTGNQIAASIPFCLDYARQTGRLSQNQTIALIGTSAGVSFGGLILRIVQ